MNSDDFEKRLQSQPMRQIPGEWRTQILQGAKQSVPSPLDPRPSFLSTLLWLNPKAWASLAVVWITIFALQFASRSGAPKITTESVPQSSVFWMSLRYEQQTLVELMGNNQPVDADQPPDAGPKPHSERQSKTAAV